jgi:hypothetical protein
MAASGALGVKAIPPVSPTQDWPQQYMGSNQTLPTASPSGAALQSAFDAVAQSQANAKMLQRWGSTIPMPVTNGAPLPTPQQQCISLGPFPEPRALSFEEVLICNDGQTQGELDPGDNPAINLLYYVTIGVGTATVSYVFQKLPSVLFAQSLTVSVARNDNTVFGFMLSVWAQPYAPRGEPTALTTSFVRFTGGSGASIIGGPPNFATHVVLGMPPDDAVDCIFFLTFSCFASNLQLAPPVTNGSARFMLAQKFGATPAAGAWWQAQPIAIPPRNAGNCILSRTNTVAQYDVALTWLRV